MVGVYRVPSWALSLMMCVFHFFGYESRWFKLNDL